MFKVIKDENYVTIDKYWGEKCGNCDEYLEPDWKWCPYCGEIIERSEDDGTKRENH